MKKTIFLILITCLLITSGCKKGFLSELQNNPNAPTTSAATVQLVLPGAITNLAGTVNGEGAYETVAVWMGYWNYAGGYSFNAPVQNYVLTNATPQVWDNYYGVLTNLNVIYQDASSTPSLANYAAISNILEALCYKNLVDAYNNVPYSHALKGQGDFFPSYDNGSDIYDSLVLNLDKDITSIQSNLSNASVITPTSDDVMFGGNMNNWLLFANTLKLKLLVQQSAVTAKQSFITTEATKTASVGYLTTDALVNPGYTSAQPSPMYGAFGVAPAGGVNGSFNYVRSAGFAVDFYKTANDPRLAYFAGPLGTQPNDAGGSSNDYYSATLPPAKANYYGDYMGIQSTNTSKSSGIGPGLIQNPGQSAVMMTAAESYFVQAEAVVRGYLTGNAQQLYQSGITASFEYLNIGGNPDTYAMAYYNQIGVANVSWPLTTAQQIQTIITQKWAALNGINNMEAWNDWRRTFNSGTNSGYPAAPLSQSPSLSPSVTHMPFRFYYPLEEPNTNNAAWLQAGGDKVDPFTSKIFWMP
ncbi:MAG TPA: SusD/RagB family nutrient-binding outer membrane lipoprotein [Hanamia sp.]